MLPQDVRAADAIVFLLCPADPMYVPCQLGLVRRAGESITHIQQRRHHMTRAILSCLVNNYYDFLRQHISVPQLTCIQRLDLSLLLELIDSRLS